MDFRCVKLYIPPRDGISQFENFLEFCAYQGINTVILELGGAFEYINHKEINEGWVDYCKQFAYSSDATLHAQYANNFPKNAIHSENGGGNFLSRAEMLRIVDCCAKLGLEIIPEVPSLSHSDYLLARHHDFAERKEDVNADHYCPSNGAVYTLLFELMDEVIEVFNPRYINIGHDELYSVAICEKCRGKSAEDLFVNDIMRIYEYLLSRGVGVIMWADKLLESRDKTGINYGGSQLSMVYEEEKGGGVVNIGSVYGAAKRLPKDIILLHWHYLFGESSDNELISLGYKIIFGNINPVSMPNCKNRLLKKGSLGYCVSNWSSAAPHSLQRNGIYFSIAYMNCMLKGEITENLKTDIEKISNNLYNYRKNQLKGEIVEITHSCSEPITHREFVDGNSMDYQRDYLGHYRVLFEDGSSTYENIYFGLNINIAYMCYNLSMNTHFNLFDYNQYLLESTYSCRYIFNEGKTQYEYCFAVKSPCKIAAVEFIPNPLYKAKVSVVRILCGGKVYES